MPVLAWSLQLLLGLVIWLGMAYGIHRLAHWSRPWNRLHLWHRAHHAPSYLEEPRRFRWHHALLCFGSVPETLDIWVTLTLPLLLVALLLPQQGALLLLFHYVYEILFSDQRLDHNPRIRGPLTRVFAWGQYHLHHHADPRRNFGLILTVWDHVFATDRCAP
jgi:sterol desaturase/sphingolipid hydroxylase (fatty acid hydroxylase superfamily)